MIIDLNDVDGDPFADRVFDVCICGAGVAGITLAQKLSSKLDVLLLEGGGLEYSVESQNIYRGEIVGRPSYPLETARLRYFGGTSNHWAGWCHPLDESDFLKKLYLKYSGWPIRRGDLDPYLTEAGAVLDLTEDRADQASAYEEGQLGFDILQANDFRRVGFKWSPPTRFGEKFRDDIEHSSNVTCFLNANVVDVSLHANLTRVSDFEVRDMTGKSYRATAKTFIVAAGGIENPRVLLNANRQIPAGIGNENDLVGRFFADHHVLKVGRFILEDDARERVASRHWNNESRKNDWYFAPTPEFMEREQILNFGLVVVPDREPSSGLSFKKHLSSLVCKSEWSQSKMDQWRDTPMWCPGGGFLRMVSEQSPNPLSRVTLGSDTDRFGVRRSVLDWRHSDIDLRTIQRAVIRLGEVLAKKELGRVQVDNWLLQDQLSVPDTERTGGWHHMCTTRMASNKSEGVVDENLRVFGTDNLFIGGSSVFATTGHDCPTISIVQLALRLADHINSIHKVRQRA